MKFSRQKMQHLKWLRRKEFIRINCFIMIAILLMVLLFMGFPIVSEASSPLLSDQFYFNSILNREDALEYYGDDTQPYTAVLSTSSWRTPFFDKTDAFNYEDELIDIVNQKSPDISSLSNPNLTVLINDNTNLEVIFHENDIITNYTNASNNSLTITGNCIHYQYRISDGRFQFLNNNSISYSGSNKTLRILITTADIQYRYNNVSTNIVPMNYMLSQNLCGKGAGGFNANPLSTDYSNHLRLYENSVCYLAPTSMKNGNFYIYGNFDEEQKKYPDRYRVHINISCDYSCYKNVEATYICKADNGQNINNLYPINTTTTNFTAETVLSYDVSDFNNGKLVIPLSTINDSLRFSNTYPVTYMAQGFSNLGADNTLFVPFLQDISGSSVAGVKIDFSGVTNGSFNTVLTGCNYHFDVYVAYKNPNNDTNTVVRGEEASLVYDYDFIAGSGNLNYSNLADDQKVKEATDSQTIPPAYNYDTNKPTYDNTLPSSNNNDNSSNSNSNSSDNITVSGGDNSINNIVNVNQGNKYPEKGVMQSFVRIINNDKNNTVNDIDTLIGGSSYIQLMNNALVAVPDQVWSIWITALKAILGIAVSAFFLKILINWAT